MKLRDYQLHAHDLIIEGFKALLKLLLIMPTGTGKSKTIIAFVKRFCEHYNFVIVVRKRDLVEQLICDLELFELDYGVFMAGHPKYSPKKPIQICSIDTMTSREMYPHVNNPKDVILVIDEADETLGEGYQEMINRYTRRAELTRPTNFTVAEIKAMRNAFLVGLTATAYDKALPHFDRAIFPITAAEALKRGYLVAFEYVIPKLIDLANVKILAGEFKAADVDLKFNSPKVIRLCFEQWQKFGENRQTLVFCSNQNHAKNVEKFINDYYGQNVAVAVDSNTPSEQRKEVYNQFSNGVIRFLINVRLITRGVDIPIIGCILDMAMTASINLHIQKLGRGSRPNPVYKDCIVIDMANNCVRNGPFYYDRPVNLKEVQKRDLKNLPDLMRVCGKCFRGYSPEEHKNKCPYCNTVTIPEERKLSKSQNKKIEMEKATPEKILQLQLINEYKSLLWKFQNLKERYPKDIAKEKAHRVLIKKHGLKIVLQVKETIGLTDRLIEENTYKPLGGSSL